MKRSEFELLVTKALADIPLQFQYRLENVDVVVEDVPSEKSSGVFLSPHFLLNDDISSKS